MIDGKTIEAWPDPLAALDEMVGPGNRAKRWAGYLSYDLARELESLPAIADDDLGLPLFAFTPVEIKPQPGLHMAQKTTAERTVDSNFTRANYETAVQRVLDYIAAGDAYQVNLAQRLTVRRPPPAEQVYARLQRDTPADFAALIAFDAFQLVSNSPELFFYVTPDHNGGRRIVCRPIKGTRPLGEGMRDELLHSAKDAAELAMIVDLQRNDMGRVCRVGSVRVTEPRVIESHPTVLHSVATIEGVLREEASVGQIVRAMFPCGSITGCPKIRAMQIIEELEPHRRNAYCGAIGYIDADGSMQFSVAIRTVTIAGGAAYVSVGGGIVADSRPAAEYDETIVKAAAMLDALGVGRKVNARRQS